MQLWVDRPSLTLQAPRINAHRFLFVESAMLIGQKIGPFEIESELGSGAMGSVYRAILRQDGKADKIVALKVIAFGLSGNEQALARFEREANILKQLRHPNIVRLYATGRHKKTPFFAMEYVAGQSLDKIMADRTTGPVGRAPFTWEEVVELGKPLCAALQHAHDKGIIHRDLKPSNLMMSNEGIIKLTDFGIAKDVDVTALTGANNTIGTAAYMSPEQCKGEKYLTGKSDIYSLGVVFYELLTGRKPFMAESSVDMFLMHVNGEFIRPAQLQHEIPVWLDTLVAQMMEKKPEHRPRDAAMVGQVLDEIAEKMAGGVSVGGDLAGARAVDRKKLSGKEDRAAARAIRAGSRKKKLKKKRRPIYTRNWFVALACLLLLGGIGWFVWEAGFAPPTPESLLKKIDDTKDPVAQKDFVARYLKHYGSRDDDASKRVKELNRKLKVDEREAVLLNRYRIERLRNRSEDDDDPDAYKKTMTALTLENEGDLATARREWSELIDKYGKESAESKALWAWHAQRKLDDLRLKESQIIELDRELQKFRLDDIDPKFDDDLKSRVVTAIRVERLDDYALAKDRWNQIAKILEGDMAKRPEYVLARSHARRLEVELAKKKEKDAVERPQLVAQILARAKTLLTNELPARRTDGRNLLRDIRDIYTGERGEIEKLVEEAKTLLAKNPGQ